MSKTADMIKSLCDCKFTTTTWIRDYALAKQFNLKSKKLKIMNKKGKVDSVKIKDIDYIFFNMPANVKLVDINQDNNQLIENAGFSTLEVETSSNEAFDIQYSCKFPDFCDKYVSNSAMGRIKVSNGKEQFSFGELLSSGDIEFYISLKNNKVIKILTQY